MIIIFLIKIVQSTNINFFRFIQISERKKNSDWQCSSSSNNCFLMIGWDSDLLLFPCMCIVYSMPRVRHCVTMRTNTRVQRHCACVNNGLENITLIFTLYLPRNNTFHVGILRPAETTRQRGCANNAQVNNASICRQQNHKWCTVMSLPRRTGEVVAVLFVRGVSATLSYRIVLMVYERLSVISPPPPQQPPSLSSTGPWGRL